MFCDVDDDVFIVQARTWYDKKTDKPKERNAQRKRKFTTLNERIREKKDKSAHKYGRTC